MTKWIFGYSGDSLVFWLMAKTYKGLCQQISKRGMATPDWYENTGHGSL